MHLLFLVFGATWRFIAIFAKDDIIAAILQLPELISFMLLVVVFGNFTNKR